MSKKRIIVLSGVSGTGKTYLRLTDPDLSSLPYVDIADIYKEFPEIDWATAAAIAVKRVARLLAQNDEVILEGYFLRGSPSRQGLRRWARIRDWQLKFVELWAPLEVCTKRIDEQVARGEITWAEADDRLRLLGRCWKPKHKEEQE